MLKISGKFLAYSWTNVDVILVVWNVNFIISTDHEAPDKTVVAWPQMFLNCSAIITEFSIDRDIRRSFFCHSAFVVNSLCS